MPRRKLLVRQDQINSGQQYRLPAKATSINGPLYTMVLFCSVLEKEDVKLEVVWRASHVVSVALLPAFCPAPERCW